MTPPQAGQSPSPMPEQSFNLQGKPFVRALLACGHAWALENEAVEDAALLQYIAAGEASLDQAAAAAINAVHHITYASLNNIGRRRQVDPQAVPEDINLVVAYGLFLLAGMHSELKAEGVTLDFRELGVTAVRGFYHQFPEEERINRLVEAIETFQAIATSSAEIIQQWHENLVKLVRIYVIQTATHNEQLEHVQCIPLFGSMLSGLLGVAAGD